MKTLYIECNMGAAGDMLMSALLELHPDPEKFISRLNSLGIPGVSVSMEKSMKCGITGTHVNVIVNGEAEGEDMHHEHHHHHHHHEHGDYEHEHEHHEHEHHEHHHEHGYHTHEHDYSEHYEHHEHHHHHHSHRDLDDIESIISDLRLNEKVEKNALDVYALIAGAESRVHNTDVDEIHFHEVGTMDAVTDIVGVCMLIDELGIEKIVTSPVNIGKGSVDCAHGTLPVPAPATAYILREVPVYSNETEGELCTPTGAALLKYFTDEFSSMPLMRIEKTGYGMGTKDFDTANCVRVFMGETETEKERVAELTCNIDDMTGEAIGFAEDRLFEAGALEVFTTPVGMKKGRPGLLLTVICAENKKEDILRTLFKHTSTIGVRENIAPRYTLKREFRTVDTNYGPVKVKLTSGYGVVKEKAEYDDLEKIAIENNISISDIKF